MVEIRRYTALNILLLLAVLALAACGAQVEAGGRGNLPAAGEGAQTAVAESAAVSAQANVAPTTAAGAGERAEAPVEPSATAVETESDERQGVVVPPRFQTFYHVVHGYMLTYPSDWGACTEYQYALTFCEIQAEPAGLGPPLRLYVQAVPQDYTNPDGQVYNYMPAESIRGFLALAVGESQLKEPEAFPAESFTYTRLPDQTVAGRTAAVIENSQVWEAPEGTKDRVVLIVTEEVTYMIGAYYETPEQLAWFEQVLASFQIDE